LNIEGFSASLKYFYEGAPTVTRISQFSRLVEVAAERDDDVALRILMAAGKELALHADALIRRLQMRDSPLVSYHGAVLRECRLVRESFQTSLGLLAPGARVRAPLGDAVYGAYVLARNNWGGRQLK
jgi:N-acetylglucosamine kinase-like BadF-type ATPase